MIKTETLETVFLPSEGSLAEIILGLPDLNGFSQSVFKLCESARCDCVVDIIYDCS